VNDETLADAILACRASAQTDSLAVVWDLTTVAPAAEAAILDLLKFGVASEHQLPPQDCTALFEACGQRYNSLLEQGEVGAALQLATMIGVFFHECRHIHDVRLTRAGAELLMLELSAYNDAPFILESLQCWQQANPSGRIRYPLTPDDMAQMGLDAKVIEVWRRALAQRALTEGVWTRKSAFTTLPGFSIRDLFETLGFFVQMEITAQAFGAPAAELIFAAMSNAAKTYYSRPAMVLQTLCQARQSADPQPVDVSSLLTDALTVSGIAEAFDANGAASARHPGAWFDRFAAIFATTPTNLHANPLARSIYAADKAVEAEGLANMLARIDAAGQALSAEQQRLMQVLAMSTGKLRAGSAILVVTDVGIDFRDMQRAVRCHQRYHQPLGYAQLLMEGALTGVYLSVLTSAGGVVEVRTPSFTPSNHIGAFRAAAQGAKQMRRLATGRPPDAGFLDDMLLCAMIELPPEGLGLNLWLKQ
jgi:hypothetical protein